MLEREKVRYRYFYGSCLGILFFLLILIFNYIGFAYMVLIIGDLLVVVIFSWFIKRKSDKLTQHFEMRISGMSSILQGRTIKKVSVEKGIVVPAITH